jgi:1-deoxy-D-xylulose 5-phosphate reductoisomerase
MAVDAFLSERIKFTDIDQVIEATLKTVSLCEPSDLAAVQALDGVARATADGHIFDIAG